MATNSSLLELLTLSDAHCTIARILYAKSLLMSSTTNSGVPTNSQRGSTPNNIRARATIEASKEELYRDAQVELEAALSILNRISTMITPMTATTTLNTTPNTTSTATPTTELDPTSPQQMLIRFHKRNAVVLYHFAQLLQTWSNLKHDLQWEILSARSRDHYSECLKSCQIFESENNMDCRLSLQLRAKRCLGQLLLSWTRRKKEDLIAHHDSPNLSIVLQSSPVEMESLCQEDCKVWEDICRTQTDSHEDNYMWASSLLEWAMCLAPEIAVVDLPHNAARQRKPIDPIQQQHRSMGFVTRLSLDTRQSHSHSASLLARHTKDEEASEIADNSDGTNSSTSPVSHNTDNSPTLTSSPPNVKRTITAPAPTTDEEDEKRENDDGSIEDDSAETTEIVDEVPDPETRSIQAVALTAETVAYRRAASQSMVIRKIMEENMRIREEILENAACRMRQCLHSQPENVVYLALLGRLYFELASLRKLQTVRVPLGSSADEICINPDIIPSSTTSTSDNSTVTDANITFSMAASTLSKGLSVLVQNDQMRLTSSLSMMKISSTRMSVTSSSLNMSRKLFNLYSLLGEVYLKWGQANSGIYADKLYSLATDNLTSAAISNIDKSLWNTVSHVGMLRRENPLREGWLTKLGAVRKSWKRRFFRLFVDRLVYLEGNKSQSKKKNEILIKRVTEIRKTTAEEAQTKGDNSFCIVTQKRTFFARTSSFQELEAWLNDLTYAISLELTDI